MLQSLSIELFLLTIFAGGLAGFINTLAGSGSLITLPMLIFLGLPANVANGTNRVGILIQCAVSAWKLHQAKTWRFSHSQILRLFVPTILGAMGGAWIAVDVSEEAMKVVIAIVMFVMLGVIWNNPAQWLRENAEEMVHYKPILTGTLLFLIGLYGGFIQAGTGILLVGVFVMSCGFTLVQATSLKILLIGIFNLPVLFIFALNGQVVWLIGLIMSIGQAVGAWIAAHYLSNHTSATLWVRRLLLLIIFLSASKMIWDLVQINSS